jgi:ATP-binding cassette, subfamily B, bacterial MsbA
MINELTKIKNTWAIYKRLLKAAFPYWATFLLGLIGTILASGTDASLSWLIKPMVDNGLVAKQREFIIWLPIIITAGFIIRAVTLFASNYFITRVGRSVVMDFRKKIFTKLMSLPIAFYDKESSGQLLSLVVYNTDQLALAITDAILTILQEGLQLIGLVLVMFIINWQLSLLFLLIAPMLAIIIRYTTKRLRHLSSKVQRTVGDVTHIAEEGIHGIKVIRTFGGENYECEKFNKAAEYNRHSEMKVVVTNSLGTSLTQIIASLPIALIIYIATLPNLHITIGGFSAIIAAMVRLLTPLRRLTKVNNDIQRGVAAANSIFSLLDSPAESDTGTKRLDLAKGHIEYRKVTFSYPLSNKIVLDNININIEPNQTVALVGRSGGGKSTLVNLLPRFYDVINGAILIDGINIQEYKLADLRQQFALVSQHVMLFNDTLAKNIAYGRFDKVTETEIMQAIEAAYLTDLVKQLPQGLNTMIGKDGSLISGGQRQRVAIARALLKNAPILILDEATSALDTESEHYIQEALNNLMQKRTTFVIAHRLSTVEKADKIIVIDQGQIVENGTHNELLTKNGQYAKFYKMQFKKNLH